MKRDIWVVVIVTIYLVIYTIFTVTGVDSRIIMLMYMCSPLLLLYMVYTVLKHGEPPQKELEENEEWGYADVEKKDLGVF